MSLVCPSCQSEDVKSLSVVFLAGLSKAKGSVGGVGIGLGGGVGFGAGLSDGTNQTYLSKRAAPPPKCNVRGWGCLMSTGIIILIIYFLAEGFKGFLKDPSFTLLLASILFIVGSFGSIKANEYNSKTWPILRNKWEKSFMCLRCGTMFKF